MTVDKYFLTNLKQCLSNYTIADMVDRNIITNYKTWLIDLDLMIKKLSEEFILTLLNLDKLVDKYAQQLNRNGKHLNCYTAKHCYHTSLQYLCLTIFFWLRALWKWTLKRFARSKCVSEKLGKNKESKICIQWLKKLTNHTLLMQMGGNSWFWNILSFPDSLINKK